MILPTSVTIVVPTYNEGENVSLLVEGIHSALKDITHDILFVDDSTDSTLEELIKLKNSDPTIDVFARQVRTGLGTAIVEGLQRARGGKIIVMDADLQHPTHILKLMVEEMSDIVIPSRFIPGGEDGGLNWYRKLISSVARYLAKAILPRVRPISDPTSGYFLINRSVIDGINLNPIGWKTLLDILVRGNYRTVVEIPYHFAVRHAGKSKLTPHASFDYLLHLSRLYISQFSLKHASPQVIRRIIPVNLGM